MPTRSPVLVVAATDVEARAVVAEFDGVRTDRVGGVHLLRAAHLLVAISGVGLAEAAAATTSVIAAEPVDAVLSMGVAGGHGLPLGSIAVARTVTRADTGVEEADGSFRTTDDAFGAGPSTGAVSDAYVEATLRRLPHAVTAHLLSVATVTGTADGAARVLARAPGPGPAAEDMEAWGVYVASKLHSVEFGAVKAVSNPIGPRDRSAWDLDGALKALSHSAFLLFRETAERIES